MSTPAQLRTFCWQVAPRESMMSDEETTMHTEVNPEGPVGETIGARLRRLRTERRLSQRELSEPGVSYAYISRIEANTRTPSVKALRKLARKLGVSPEYLETGSEIGPIEQRELELADAELKLRLDPDPSSAEAALERVLEESTQAGDLPSAARARLALGLAAAQRGDHQDAVRRLEEALESGVVTPSARPDVYTTLGRCYSILGKSARAVDLFERCLEELKEDPEANVAARTRFATYLSYALTDLGDLARAETVVTEAVSDAEDIADPYTQIRLYWSLARLATMQGRPAAALGHVRRAIALLEATEDTVHLARAHVLCAFTLNLNGSSERAVQHLETAERLFGARPEPDDLVSLRCEQARAAAQLGDADTAVSRGQEVLELLGEENPAEQGNAWWAIAEGLAIRGDSAGADDSFRRAADLLSGEGRWREASQACRAWAKMLRKAGRESEALDVLERAADLAARRESSEAHVPR
jgi:tetratricopeptide (TPR) repeat protein